MNISEDKERQDLLRSALFNGNKNVTFTSAETGLFLFSLVAAKCNACHTVGIKEIYI